MKTLSIIMTHYSTDEYKSITARNIINILRRSLDDNCELIISNTNPNRDSAFVNLCDYYIPVPMNSLGAARNLGFDKSSGVYICFIDNDIKILDNSWWKLCIDLLEKYKEYKLIATPIATKHHSKYNCGILDGHRLNLRIGSNCLFMRRETFQTLGYFDAYEGDASRTGVKFCDRQCKMGYKMIYTGPGYAEDIGTKNYKYQK